MAKAEIRVAQQIHIDRLNQVTQGIPMLRDAGISEHLDKTELKIAKSFLAGAVRELRADGFGDAVHGVLFDAGKK